MAIFMMIDVMGGSVGCSIVVMASLSMRTSVQQWQPSRYVSLLCHNNCVMMIDMHTLIRDSSSNFIDDGFSGWMVLPF